jgi:uncharacterized protein YjiS (DUF1127 family)
MNNSPAGRRQITTRTRRLRSRLRQLWSVYWQYKARRAAVVVLPMLDDRILEDIGLTRTDVRAIMFAGDTDRVRLHEADGSDGARADTTTTQSAAVGRERPPPEAASARACLTPP